MGSKPLRALSVALAAAAAAVLAGCSPGQSDSPASATTSPADQTTTTHNAAFAGLEGRYHARLGISAIDTGTGRSVSYRSGERFAHCSTFKALLAGEVLRRSSDADLDAVLPYTAADLVDYSPVTSKHTGSGMSTRELLTAAVEYSDNTAANLLLGQVGGPAGLQRALRGIGDPTTHVDRLETAMDDAVPGDIRDTTTPHAIAGDLRALVLGDTLPPVRRAQLTDLLLGNTTGAQYIRAGVPSGSRVGDKTGSGGYGTRNDIAVVWPPQRAPIVIAVLSDRGVAEAKSADGLIADATREALAELS